MLFCVCSKSFTQLKASALIALDDLPTDYFSHLTGSVDSELIPNLSCVDLLNSGDTVCIHNLQYYVHIRFVACLMWFVYRV